MDAARSHVRTARLSAWALISLAAAVPACSAQSDAPGESWVLVQTGAEARMYLDTARMAIAGDERTVRLRADYDVPETVPDDPGKQFWGVVTEHRLNCAERTVTDLGMTLLDSAGAPMDTAFTGTRWKTFASHPFGEHIFPEVCRRQRSPG